MSDASRRPDAPEPAPGLIPAVTPADTIDPREAAHFGRLAADWWDPKGSSAMLHRLNPVRLGYIRDQIDQHWSGDECDRRPLAGRRAADVGCGAGLLAEPLRRLGADVTAIDAAPENIAAARVHAEGQGLDIDYRVGGVELLAGPYDLVTSLEVIEHVSDTRKFVHGLAAALGEDGLLILSTPNRTSLSRLLMIVIGEGFGRIPKGSHDWEKFLTPEETCALLADAGLEVIDVTGLSYNVMRGFSLSENKALDYFVTAKRLR
jgi:2-polyprenyl-6-hydroxyphenyl methylase/3-demethylubiquinone-9 3-methyltransferase